MSKHSKRYVNTMKEAPKKADLNTTNVEAAMRMIAGTARNMGIEVID